MTTADLPIEGLLDWLDGKSSGSISEDSILLPLAGDSPSSEHRLRIGLSSLSAARGTLPAYLSLSLEGISATHKSARPSLRDRRILVAEDGRDNQMLIRRGLEKEGAEVIIVDDGAKALHEALSRDFDLILMDMQMPVMTGFESARALRTRGYAGAIVALTAATDAESRTRCLLAGCSHFMGKPIDRKSLVAMVCRLLDPQAEGLHDEGLASADDLLLDDAEFRELTMLFIDQLDSRVTELQDVIDAENWKDLEIFAHRLKGAAGGFGLPEISRISSELEETAKADKNLEDANKSIAQLLSLLEEIPRRRVPAGQV